MLTRLLAIIFLLALAPQSVSADFSDSWVTPHPQYPGDGPFVIEISGTWPSDCHPGEQKPFLKAYDGETVEIDFEIVVVHITCNDTDTRYRALLDMSQAVRETKPVGETLEINVNFQGVSLEQSIDLVCTAGEDCSTTARQMPERGLFINSGRASEGLLIARQNGIAAVYPLVYGPAGTAEWLFSVGNVSGDAYFADLYRFYDGDCFLCEPEGAQPEMEHVGLLSILFDQQGQMQVKVNDRPFTTYQKLVYGYDVFLPKMPGGPMLVGLEGRWGLSENRGTDPPLGDLTNFLPAAFDIHFDTTTPAPDGGLTAGQIYYLVTTVTGQELGQLVCKGETSTDGSRQKCDFIDPTDAAEPLLLFFLEGPSTLSIEYGRAVIAVGTPPGGKAVRLD